jgi:hypothetical protein
LDSRSDTLAASTQLAGGSPPKLGRPRRRRVLRWALIGGSLLLLVLIGVVIDGELQALHYARDLKQEFPALQSARHDLLSDNGSGKGIDRIESDVANLQSKVDHARFTFGLTGWLPFVGRPVDAVRLATDAASSGAHALVLGREVVDTVRGTGAGSTSLMHDGTVNVALIQGLIPKVTEVVSSLQTSYDDINAIPHIPFVGQLDRLKSDALGQLGGALTAGRRALAAVKVLPTMFGADTPQTYFLALQNNADLRATGGAVLGWGIVQISDGHLSLDGGGPIKQLDHATGVKVKLPRPVRWYLHLTGRNPRINNGMNYSPNMPMVAPTWAAQVQAATGRHINGVIALDPVGVAALLKGQGKVRIPGYDKPLDSHNIADFTEHGQYSLPQQVQAVLPGQLVKAAFGALTNPHDVVGLATSMSTAIADKRIQLWSSNADVTALLKEMGWSNGIDHSGGDYLYLTDNKRNGNKVDYFTHASVDDTVTIDENGDAKVNVLITLDNRTPPGESSYVVGPWKPYALNVAMLSLYVPDNARDPLVSPAVGAGFPNIRPQNFVAHREGYRRVFTKIITAWPGHPGTLRFQYTIPHVIHNLPGGGKEYRLVVQHQPLAHPLDLTVHLVLPKGSSVTGTDRAWKTGSGEVTFHAPVTRDFATTVTYQSASASASASS